MTGQKQRWRPLLFLSLVVAVGALAILVISSGGGQEKKISAATLNADLQRTLRAASGQPSGNPHSGSEPGPAALARAYVVRLTAAQTIPRSGRHGVADALIRLVPRRHRSAGQVCWRISAAHAVDKPTQASIHLGARHSAGLAALQLGAGWKANGCTTAANRLMIAIARNPDRYYIDVDTIRYPAGAVRAQL
jgi:hypothetical protein